MIERGQLWWGGEKGVLTGKGRPLLVVQRSHPSVEHSTVTVCLISSLLSGESSFRVWLDATPETGLEHRSEVQVDRIYSLQRKSFERVLGRAPADVMRRVDLALRRWLDL